MSKFIENVVDHLIELNLKFETTTIILPGNRPQLFFRKTFSNRLRNTILPKFKSIDDWLIEISGLRTVSQINLWFQAYQSYLKITETPDEFENFIKWFPTLLKDFDDIQTSLVNADDIFEYLVSAERIKKWGKENLEIGSNDLITKHLYFWKIAKQLFYQLNHDLVLEGIGYKGLIYKIAYENLNEFSTSTDQNYVFVGLNALSNAESKIVFTLENQGKAILFWDSDQYYMKNSEQEAGQFLRMYREKEKIWNWEFDEFSKEKNIYAIGIGKRVGQAKYLSKILDKIPTENLSDTMIVLAEESLLPSVLSALPERVNSANITMGFPLNKSSMAYFFRSIFELHMNREKLGNGQRFYYKNILAVLQAAEIKDLSNESLKLSQKIRYENRIFSDEKFLIESLENSIYQDLFQIFPDVQSFIHSLINWIEGIMSNGKVLLNELDQEYLYRFSILFNQLVEEISNFPHIHDFRTLYSLYGKIMQNEIISFVGEPLQGLQIAGLLETRLLDFKNLIILSANEGILPPGRTDHSYIPFDIRREMGMQTFTENDAVFAYHFYRLMQRSQQVYLLYNTESDALGSGEKSRFITQMELESNHKIVHQVAVPDFQTSKNHVLEIQKTEIVKQRLETWCESGISASSLNAFIRNPILFYEQKILGVSEFEDAEETVGARVLGNIVHKSLEEIYKPILHKIVLPNDFKMLEKNCLEVVEENFKMEYKSGEYKKGKNLLIFKIAERFVKNVIQNDAKIASNQELIIHQLESKWESELTLCSGKIVKLYGVIDRIDEINGIKRIIDFKTGNVDERSLQINSEKLGKVSQDMKYDKVLQLLFYAKLYFSTNHDDQVQFGIYPLKRPKDGFLRLKVEKGDSFNSSILELVDPLLIQLIEEILDPNIPFVEKQQNQPTWF